MTRLRWKPGAVLAVGFTLAAVVAGAVILARAARTHTVWVLRHDLAAGTVLTADDLARARIAPGTGAYLPAGDSPVGASLTEPLTAGQLLPRAALAKRAPATRVTVALAGGTAPPLAHGMRIELWVSTGSCPATPVLPDVVVQDRAAGGGGLGGTDTQLVTVAVPPALAARVVTAQALAGARLTAGVLAGPVERPAALPPLTGCGKRS